jgi:[ribosomal protein S5]-alanine N-acetyltransferase
MDASEFRVYLRALEPDDYKATHSWRLDEEIWTSVVGPKYFVSMEYEKKWVDDAILSPGNSLRLAICLKEDHKHIGLVSLTDMDRNNGTALCGILIGEKSLWGMGLGAEAILLMLHHGFYTLGLTRIEARQLLSDHASVRLFEKCRFKVEGVLRKAASKDGRHKDLNQLSILREEYDELLLEKGLKDRAWQNAI